KTEGDWAFGVPTGSDRDPASGYTGPNVYGNNLAGAYTNNLPKAFYLTSPALDCSRFEKVSLFYARWLTIERSLNDHASVEVSTNGTNWITVWSNPSNMFMTASDWENVSHDISAVADRQRTVFMRWGMGPTDGSWTAGGWNIDDI